MILPGCPIALWNLEYFKLIGNSIGKFLHVDLKQMVGFQRQRGKLLVEMDTFESFPEEIDIIW
jgi:hypothetical protein